MKWIVHIKKYFIIEIQKRVCESDKAENIKCPLLTDLIDFLAMD